MKNLLLTKNNIDLASILKPDTAFNSIEGIQNTRKIYYISDIHLLHHINIEDYNFKKQINEIVGLLYTKELIDDIINDEHPYIIFCGDTCSSSKILKYFYHLFKIKYLFYLSKAWNLKYEKIQAVSKKQALILYKNKLKELKKSLKKISFQLDQCGYNSKKLYQMVLNDKSYPEYIDYKVSKFERLKREIKELEEEKEDYINSLTEGNKFDHNIYNHLPIIVVLGNHELNDFKSIDNANDYYTKFFKEERIWFLHNSMLTGKYLNILGGIGFAKFNDKHNANTLCSTNPPISRAEEILESDKFLNEYRRALAKSISDNKLLIVVSHYPIEDWLPEEKHSICVYFHGHSHQNKSIHTSTVQVYADNQIGYTNKRIQFKSANIGINYNPFICYQDGYYEITTAQYIKFLIHKGEYIKGTGLIDQQLQYNAKFYMIKQNGFYSFFVINQKTGTKICEGGRIKTISKIKDIEYFYKNFPIILNKYLSLFAPYRKMQQQISNELKQLGFDGKIHGSIIDIDYFSHVMLDPIDGKLTFYYSPEFGVVKTFNSFKYLVRTLIRDEELEFNTELLNKHNDYLILQSTNTIQKNISDVIFVDRKNSIYDLSSKINQIQRIFDCNILREWNDAWAQETSNQNNSTFPIKSDEECDLIIEERFDEFITIEKEEKGFVLWAAKKMIKQEIMYSICRKFISTYTNILEKYKNFDFGFNIFDKERYEYNFANVACSLKDFFSVHKKLLSVKFGHNDVLFFLEYNKKSAKISVELKGTKEMLKYVGNYNYCNNELVEDTRTY